MAVTNNGVQKFCFKYALFFCTLIGFIISYFIIDMNSVSNIFFSSISLSNISLLFNGKTIESKYLPTGQIEIINLSDEEFNTKCKVVVTDSPAGMFSNVHGVLRAIYLYGKNIKVLWRRPMYRSEKNVNAWTQYFEPISKCKAVPETPMKEFAGSRPFGNILDPEISFSSMTKYIKLNRHMQNTLLEAKHRLFAG